MVFIRLVQLVRPNKKGRTADAIVSVLCILSNITDTYLLLQRSRSATRAIVALALGHHDQGTP